MYSYGNTITLYLQTTVTVCVYLDTQLSATDISE